MAEYLRRVANRTTEWLSSYSRVENAASASKYKAFELESVPDGVFEGVGVGEVTGVALLRWKGGRSSSYRLVVAGWALKDYGSSLSGVSRGTKGFAAMETEYARATWLAPLVAAYASSPVLAGPQTRSTIAMLDALKTFVADPKSLPKAYTKRVTAATPPEDQVLYFAMVNSFLDYLAVVKPPGATIMAVHDSLGNSPLHVAIELLADPDFLRSDPYSHDENGFAYTPAAAAADRGGDGDDDDDDDDRDHASASAPQAAGLDASPDPVPTVLAPHASDLHPMFLTLVQNILLDPELGTGSGELAAVLATPNAHGDTLVHSAAACNLVPILRALLAHGCDPAVPNANGETAMHVAIEASALGAVRLLVSLGHGGTAALEWAMAAVAEHASIISALDGKLGNAELPKYKRVVKKKALRRIASSVATVCTLLQLGSPFEPVHIEQATALGSVDILRAFVVFGGMAPDDARFKPALAAIVTAVVSAAGGDAAADGHYALLEVLVLGGLDPRWLIESDASILANERLTTALLAFSHVPFSADAAAALAASTSGSVNVLALDGGGIRGLLLVDMLAELMAECRKISSRGAALEVWDVFDVFCGTSTGAILAAALGIKRLDLDACARLYFDFAADVFDVAEPLYNPAILRGIVERLIGKGVRMSDVTGSRVFVVATDVTTSPPSTFVLRNYEPDSPFAYAGTHTAEVADAVLATSAAPTFFPAHAFHDDASGADLILCDGALVYNSPAIPALMETSELDVAHLINLGTGSKMASETRTVADFSPQLVPKIIHSKSGSVPSKLASSFISGGLGMREVSAFRNCLDAIMEASFGGDETQPVEYMCSRQSTAFARFNPPLSSAALDEGSIVVIVGLLWESRCFIRAHAPRLRAIAASLVASKPHL